MRTIQSSQIADAVEQLCNPAATKLPQDVFDALQEGLAREESSLGKSILSQVVENAEISRNESRPLCQDTGYAVLFVEIGKECFVEGDTVDAACQEGIRRGYDAGFLRKSIVHDPLYGRKNSGDNTPAVVHVSVVDGDKVKITLAPKGGGSENMSALKMLKPSDGEEGVIDFVVDTITNAGGNPCPPIIVGVGIGGTFEKCATIAKRALLRPVGSKNSDEPYAELEAKLLQKINETGVGPQGLGGIVTALAVHVETFPAHIASMPVAININCHAARHAEVTL